MDGSGDVEERFVDRDSLDDRGEVPEHFHDLISEALVLAEMASREAQPGAEPFRSPGRHSRSDTESLGLVGSGEHDAASYRHGLAAERWIEKLLDRRVEGVEIGVQDRGPSVRRHRLQP